MSRIVYFVTAPGSRSGGNKMTFRHVEALQSLGYDAVVRRAPHAGLPDWFAHTAAVEDSTAPLGRDDVLVFAEDSNELLQRCAAMPNRKIVFSQNPYTLAGPGFSSLPQSVREQYRTFIACSAGMAATIARFFDYETISVVPAFADERLFRGAPKTPTIACAPRKRPDEYRVIRYMFSRLYTGPTDWRWQALETATEGETAAAMGSASVFLSLARREAICLTTLEAMASECLIAGFTGIGPREYTSPINGLWVEEDDCEAAARALVQAALLADQGGGAAALMRHAGRVTAAQWTYAGCREALGSFWRDQMGIIP